MIERLLVSKDDLHDLCMEVLRVERERVAGKKGNTVNTSILEFIENRPAALQKQEYITQLALESGATLLSSTSDRVWSFRELDLPVFYENIINHHRTNTANRIAEESNSPAQSIQRTKQRL